VVLRKEKKENARVIGWMMEYNEPKYYVKIVGLNHRI
jgi:hypothetical protein